jgi:hypothetical protein
MTSSIGDTIALVEKLSKDTNVKVVRRYLPWDKDVELIDFYLDSRGDREDELYSNSKCTFH